MSRSSGHHSSGVGPAAGGDDYTQCSYNDEQDSIKQLAEIALRADRMEGVYYGRCIAVVNLVYYYGRGTGLVGLVCIIAYVEL